MKEEHYSQGINDTEQNLHSFEECASEEIELDQAPYITDDAHSGEQNKQTVSDPDSEDLSPVEQWIQANPLMRQGEVDFLVEEDLGFPIKITDNGELQQPFAVGTWIFLLVLSNSFPRRTEYGTIPARVYLVSPSARELSAKVPAAIMASIRHEQADMDYIDFGIIGEDEYGQFMDGRSRYHMCDNLFYRTSEWAKSAQKAVAENNQQPARRGGIQMPQLFRRKKHDLNSTDVGLVRRSKYTEGRKKYGGIVHPRCNKVVLSDRAFIQIFNESRARIQTETGGLLLGHFDKGVWYVVEASDPGINAKFFGSYHEGDDVYENHVCGVISRTYKYPLVFLGMWHRHPGSLDTFSGTDDRTNYKYAASAGNGCISAIVNYDPDFRITFYYVEQSGASHVLYTCVDIEVGNDKFARPEMMQIATIQDVYSRNHHNSQ